MSVHDETLAQCEELLASLSAAQTHLRVLIALQLDFSSVLKVYRDSLAGSREKLAEAGVEVHPGALADLGGRDDTDELLSLAVHGSAARPEASATSAEPNRQTTSNAPSIPLDDGPEGMDDDHAPLQTDEVSGEVGVEAPSHVYVASDTATVVPPPDRSARNSDDVVVMEEDDWEPESSPEARTELLSREEVQARARALAEREEDEDEDEEAIETREQKGDEEQTVLLDASTLATLIEEQQSAAAPEPEEEVHDHGSVDEVIVTKDAARAQVDASRSTPPPGAPRTKPTPKVKPKLKTRKTPSSDEKPVSAQFYAASAAIPTIRDESTPKPRAAAVRLGAEGRPAEVLGAEDEDEPIAIEGLEDEDELDIDPGAGLTLEVEEYEEFEEYEEEEEILELDEAHLEALDVAPEESAPGLSDEEIRSLLQRAQKAAKQGNLEVGVNYYSDVLDADPDCGEAYIGRGRLYLDVGDYSRAMSDFTVAEDLDPESPEPQVAVGDLYFARKDYRKAIELFDNALEIKPDHAMAFCRRGISHYYRRNYRQALDDLNEAVRLDPDIPNIKTFVSMAKKKAGARR